ncbi:MAG: glycosyltransferase, partial [Bdellovibrionales bacterium]
MPASTPPKDFEIYKRALQGRMKMIGWGYREFFHFQRWQEQFPLRELTDTRHHLWDTNVDGYAVINPHALRERSSKSHALINYFQSPWVTQYVNKTAKMAVLAPKPLQHMLRAVSTEGKAEKALRPMPRDEWQRLGDILLDELQSYIPGKQFLGQPQNFERNLRLLGKYHWTECLAGICFSIEPLKANEKCVVLAGNSWCTGGAERQMLNLAIGFTKKGWDAHSLSVMQGEDAPHYLKLLHEHDIPLHHIWNDMVDMAVLLSECSPEIRLALWHLPLTLTMRIALAMRIFKKIKPSLLISYLDWPNVIAGLGAVLAGVPRVILSGRNFPPIHFPHFFEGYTDDFHEVYRVLSLLSQVHITNNSRLGAAAYAKWLKIPPSRVSFVPNCLAQDFMSTPSKKKIAKLRKQLGLQRDDQVVLGVFRLAPEKRPDRFLAVFRDLAKALPRLKAIICGIGSMKQEMEFLVKKYGLQDRVIFTGVTGEIREMMNVADLLLHTAAFEGMPNVLLEAQSQGLPVVCTQAGGVKDSLA